MSNENKNYHSYCHMNHEEHLPRATNIVLKTNGIHEYVDAMNEFK
jgi:hypothetical protein